MLCGTNLNVYGCFVGVTWNMCSRCVCTSLNEYGCFVGVTWNMCRCCVGTNLNVYGCCVGYVDCVWVMCGY